MVATYRYDLTMVTARRVGKDYLNHAVLSVAKSDLNFKTLFRPKKITITISRRQGYPYRAVAPLSKGGGHHHCHYAVHPNVC